MDLKEEIARKRAEANSADVDESKNSSGQIIDFIPRSQQDPDAFVLMVNQIEVKEQGRKTFDDLEALASDIKTVGQLQPVVVKQIDTHRYLLV